MSSKEVIKDCSSCKYFDPRYRSCSNNKHIFEFVKWIEYACSDWEQDPEMVLKSITVLGE